MTFLYKICTDNYTGARKSYDSPFLNMKNWLVVINLTVSGIDLYLIKLMEESQQKPYSPEIYINGKTFKFGKCQIIHVVVVFVIRNHSRMIDVHKA